jgi:hypothetical protein
MAKKKNRDVEYGGKVKFSDLKKKGKHKRAKINSANKEL